MSSLSPRQQHLAAIASAAAAGDTGSLKTALAQALDGGITVKEARDVFVQLYAYAGFPRSLNALATLDGVVKERRAAGQKTDEGKAPAPLPRDTDLLALGTKTQTELVGRPVDVTALSPDIDRYLKTHLFGDIFASNVLDWQERELVTITILSSLHGADGQLASHIAVGKRNGLTDAQIAAVRQMAAPRSLSPFGIGRPNDAYAQYFSGPSYLNPLSTEQVGVYNVTFEPSVRNNWHIHHAEKGGGQILIVTGGRGYYQEWGKPARELKAGDTVNIPANVKHWHGAAKDSWFQHLAVEVPGEGTRNEWLESVSDEDYGKLP
ncbi:carboxymuconolactone decarboxylase family protein [Eikenella sp. S3360]|uniref:Carboxymuconolactone decarboxylase family protein n=2 Tax=Eikenella glucosivorans TaxID=2766967 RepID=A0ABS0NB32_9NEIS|nr:carboxymuconolactone decarboxylase family protein [Eikenella glucosivorans]